MNKNRSPESPSPRSPIAHEPLGVALAHSPIRPRPADASRYAQPGGLLFPLGQPTMPTADLSRLPLLLRLAIRFGLLRPVPVPVPIKPPSTRRPHRRARS
jgi:hypothetical protein